MNLEAEPAVPVVPLNLICICGISGRTIAPSLNDCIQAARAAGWKFIRPDRPPGQANAVCEECNDLETSVSEVAKTIELSARSNVMERLKAAGSQFREAYFGLFKSAAAGDAESESKRRELLWAAGCGFAEQAAVEHATIIDSLVVAEADTLAFALLQQLRSGGAK